MHCLFWQEERFRPSAADVLVLLRLLPTTAVRNVGGAGRHFPTPMPHHGKVEVEPASSGREVVSAHVLTLGGVGGVGAASAWGN